MIVSPTMNDALKSMLLPKPLKSPLFACSHVGSMPAAA
jgi:hypothetical protein